MQAAISDDSRQNFGAGGLNDNIRIDTNRNQQRTICFLRIFIQLYQSLPHASSPDARIEW
jgi:hypothetical protein